MNWQRRLRNFLFHREEKPGRVMALFRILYLATWKFGRDFCFERAASLTFATIISMIPFSVLFFSFVGLLGGGREIIEYVQRKILPLVTPEFHDQLILWLNRYISPTAFRTGPTGVINIAALIGLVMMAINILTTAERVFNHIWNIDRARSYLHRVTTFWMILTLSPFLILATIWAGNILIPEGGFIENLLLHHWWFGAVYRVGVPLILESFIFTFIYLFLPSASVHIVSAAIAGVTVAGLWELSKSAFYLYIARAVTITNFYKQLATVPLFFIWLFLTWVIVLWGAELCFALQNRETLTITLRKGLTGRTCSLAYLGLLAIASLYENFRRGKPVSSIANVAKTLGVTSESLAPVFRYLTEHSIIVEDARQPGHFVLAQDPEKILIDRMLRDLHGHEFPREVQDLAPHGWDPHPDLPCLAAAIEKYRKAHEAFLREFHQCPLRSLSRPSANKT